MPRASKASQCVHALRNAECIRGGKGWVLSDVLAKFVVSLDWWRGSATFSPLESSLRGDDLPVEQLMGTPVLKLCTAGCKTKALFDTAAKLDGSAKFGLDAQVPGMVYAAVWSAPP